MFSVRQEFKVTHVMLSATSSFIYNSENLQVLTDPDQRTDKPTRIVTSSLQGSYQSHYWQYDRGEPAVSYRWTGWVWDFKRITEHFRGIYRIYLKWKQHNWKMSTCNRVDLESLVPKNFPCKGLAAKSLVEA